MKNLIIAVLIVMTPLICSGESYFDGIGSTSPGIDPITKRPYVTQRAQDIISEIGPLINKINCYKEFRQFPCGKELCVHKWCLSKHPHPTISDCLTEMAILKSCEEKEAKLHISERCEKNRNNFYKYLVKDDYYLCSQILEENEDCSDWYKNASLALYHAKKRSDFPSAASSRPTYSAHTDNTISVPLIINLSQADAKKALKKHGMILVVQPGTQATSKKQVGTIHKQQPVSGSSIKPGGEVNAWVYYTEVPAVVKTPVDEAKPAITAAWFKPQKGKEIEVENETKWNKVATQSLEAGKKEFQVGLPVTLDVFVKPKKKESNSHPLAGQWEGYFKQAKLPNQSVLWNIISVSSSGKFNVISTDFKGKKEKFRGILKGSQISLSATKGAHKVVINATWNKKPMTIKGSLIPYFKGKNMMAGTGFSIILFLEKKQ